MDEPQDQNPKKSPVVQSGFKLQKVVRKHVLFGGRDLSIIIYGAIIILVTFFAFFKYSYDTHRHNRTTQLIIADLQAEEASSSYIRVTGNSDSNTFFMMGLLSIYGFHPYLEESSQIEPTVALSNQLDINLPTLLSALSTMKIVNFHEGYQDKILIYSSEGESELDKVKKIMTDKGILYDFINMNSDDPAKDGYDARLFVSGFDPGSADKRVMLEYNNKLYPLPQLYDVIKKIK